MQPLAYSLFLETSTKRLVSSPVSGSAAPPVVMPFSDDKAYVDVHLLEFVGSKMRYVDGTAVGALFSGADLTISSPDGSDVLAVASGLNFFAVDVTAVSDKQAGGSGFNAIHHVVIAPREGYFALRVSPDYDPALAELRTPAFDNLSWQAQDIEDALNEIYGAIGTIRVSKISDFSFDIEYTGDLSDTLLSDLPQVSQGSIAAAGLEFELVWDTAKRSIVEAAENGYEAVITLRGFLTVGSDEHILLSAPATVYATPDLA